MQTQIIKLIRKDPTAMGWKLIPVRAKPCEPRDLLAEIIYVDLVECSREAARKILLDGVHEDRAKPDSEPPFPDVRIP